MRSGQSPKALAASFPLWVGSLRDVVLGGHVLRRARRIRPILFDRGPDRDLNPPGIPYLAADVDLSVLLHLAESGSDGVLVDVPANTFDEVLSGLRPFQDVQVELVAKSDPTLRSLRLGLLGRLPCRLPCPLGLGG